MRSTLPILLLVAALAFACITDTAQAQPAITSIKPGAVAPGATIEVTIGGAKLNGKLKAWTSFPSTVEGIVPAKDGKSAVLKLKLAADVAPQIGGLMLGSEGGISEPIPVMVDDLPNTADAGNNYSAETAQKIPFPIAVDGVGNGVKFDFYRFQGKKGQPLSLEIVAHRLASTFDPVVRLLGPDGKEIASADDTPGFAADCQISTVLPADGDYLIEVHDNQYKNGGRYRLRLGAFPVGAAPLPMGIRRGSTVRVQLSDAAQVVTGPGQAARTQFPVAWRGQQGAALHELVLSDLPEEVEQEPNESFSESRTFTLPCAISGILQNAKDRDMLRFAAKKGRAVRVRAQSASLRSPSYVMMRIVDAKGSALAAAKVGASPELTVSFTPPADGEYCLEVRDLLFRGGPQFGYRVELSDGPDFSLALKNEKGAKVNLTAGSSIGVAVLNVQCVRHGYDGPIELSLLDAPKGFQLFGNVIPAKAKETRLVIKPPAAGADAAHVLRIQGAAAIEGRRVTRSMTTAGVLKTLKPAVPYPAAWRNGLVGLGIGPAPKPFFTVAGPKSLSCPQGSPLAPVALTLERKEKDFKTGLRVFVESSTPGLSGVVKETKGKYSLTVTAAPTAKVGAHAIKVRSIAEHKGQAQMQVLEISVQVAEAKKAALKKTNTQQAETKTAEAKKPSLQVAAQVQ